MNKTSIGLVVVTIALAGTAVWALLTSNELNRIKQELADTHVELALTADRLADTEEELTASRQETVAVEAQRSALQEEKESVESELADTESELSAVRSDLQSTKLVLSRTNSELRDATDELEETLGRLVVAEDTLDGLGITIAASEANYDADLVDNPQADNPTWAELKSFLAVDQTESHPYILNVYDCSEFSRDLHNNAEAAGIRSAVVHLNWTNNNESGHALNAFLTSDYGLVFVDSTGGSPDTVARVKKLAEYRAIDVTLIRIEHVASDWYWNSVRSYYYISTDSGVQAIVDTIIIYW